MSGFRNDHELQSWTLSQPFSIERHQKAFVHYLEVVIREDGTIEYAIPSHFEKLLAIIAEDRNLTREEAIALCPPDYYGDYLEWLVKESGCVSVWYDFIFGTPNLAQWGSLPKMEKAKIYAGKLPPKPPADSP